MGEPVNTKKRDLIEVKKGKIDMAKKPWGWTGKPSTISAPDAGEEKMDLREVDNENDENFNDYKPTIKKPEFDNFDFNKAHDDFALIKDSKKKPNAGE